MILTDLSAAHLLTRMASALGGSATMMGERSTEITGGIYEDGAYWNEEKSIWETKEQYQNRTGTRCKNS